MPDSLPSFDPYLMLQQNQTNNDDFFQQEIQYTSAVDKKKSEIIKMIIRSFEHHLYIIF